MQRISKGTTGPNLKEKYAAVQILWRGPSWPPLGPQSPKKPRPNRVKVHPAPAHTNINNQNTTFLEI